MIGAALMAREEAVGRRRHERPARRLPDADREPRGRHAARARARCATPTSSPARTRAARACCSSATACRRRSSPTTSTTSASGRPSSSRACAPARSSRWSPTPGMPLVCDPGYVLVQGCVAAGLEVEVLPGPSAALAALVASRAAGGRVALRRLPAAQARRRSRRSSRVAGDGRGVRVAAARGRLAGRAGGARPGAPGRRLPRADEAPRGGRARDGRRAGGALRGEPSRAARSCWSSAARRRGRAASRGGGRRVRAPRRGGRQAARGGRRGRGAHGRAANALYRAAGGIGPRTAPPARGGRRCGAPSGTGAGNRAAPASRAGAARRGPRPSCAESVDRCVTSCRAPVRWGGARGIASAAVLRVASSSPSSLLLGALRAAASRRRRGPGPVRGDVARVLRIRGDGRRSRRAPTAGWDLSMAGLPGGTGCPRRRARASGRERPGSRAGGRRAGGYRPCAGEPCCGLDPRPARARDRVRRGAKKVARRAATSGRAGSRAPRVGARGAGAPRTRGVHVGVRSRGAAGGAYVDPLRFLPPPARRPRPWGRRAHAPWPPARPRVATARGPRPVWTPRCVRATPSAGRARAVAGVGPGSASRSPAPRVAGCACGVRRAARLARAAPAGVPR